MVAAVAVMAYRNRYSGGGEYRSRSNSMVMVEIEMVVMVEIEMVYGRDRW